MVQTLPTERELEALKILWQRGRATVREIWQSMRQGQEELAYTTVLSLMQTMEQKGLVRHEQAGKAYLYYAKVPRQRTVRKLVRGFIDKVFDGALDQYVVHALEARRLSDAELDRLEELIAEVRRKRQRGGKGERR
jgi:predicted transcriptional regulator